MQLVSARIWTRVTVSISQDGNHYTTGTSSCSENNVSYLFPWKLEQKQNTITQLDKVSFQTFFSPIVTMFDYAFSPSTKKCFHAMLIKFITNGEDPLFTSAITAAFLRKYCLYNPSFIALNRWRLKGTKFGWLRNSMTHLFFICTFMLDAILPNCHSTAISKMPKKYRLFAGRFNLCCHTLFFHIVILFDYVFSPVIKKFSIAEMKKETTTLGY